MKEERDEGMNLRIWWVGGGREGDMDGCREKQKEGRLDRGQ
jgi:hypothetical protein